jgi:peptide/nickel transport system substrate-binding protein
LTKNPDYWNKATYDPYFDDGYIRFVTEPTSAAAAQISGDADVYISQGGIGYDVLPLYAGTEGTVEVRERTDTNSYADIRLGFADNTPFYDEKAREALDLAIDRQLLADQVIMSGIVPNGPLPVGVVGYDPSMAPYEFNPEKAKTLLAESSYDGHELKLLSMSIGLNAEDFALAITSMLQDVGFNVKPQVLDLATFNEDKDKGDWDIMPASNLFFDNDPGMYFNSRYIQDYMHSDFEGPDSETLNEFGLRYNVEPDPAKREEIMIEANHWMKDWHGPELAIASINAVWTQNYGITGIVMQPDVFWRCDYIDWDPSLAK